MPELPTLTKAILTEVWPGPDGDLQEGNKDGGAGKRVEVQFNPQSLKVTFTNQNAENERPGNSRVQFVGRGSTRLSMELWFDATLHAEHRDVRLLTRDVAFFMTPQEVSASRRPGLLPPGVRVHWGSFLFDGVMNSIDETLDHFSPEGVPLRAMLAVSLSKQDLQFQFRGAGAASGAPAAAPAAGSRPLQAARSGDSVQQMAARAGHPDWKLAALANAIENPRRLPTGALVDLGSVARTATTV